MATADKRREAILDLVGRSQLFSKKQPIFAQGDSADAAFYIQKGKVKLTVVSKIGKEATLGILNEAISLAKVALQGRLSAFSGFFYLFLPVLKFWRSHNALTTTL